MKKIATITLLVVLACATSSVFAQPQTTHTPPDPATMAQHRVSHLTTILSLTPDQQQKAATIFTNAATANAEIRSQMKAARQNLQVAVKANDTAGINQNSSTIGSLVAQMTSTEATANAAFYQILTPDQQTKLTQLQSEHHGKHFRG
jgi:Spy/CpxP family protein refolding chaperone